MFVQRPSGVWHVVFVLGGVKKRVNRTPTIGECIMALFQSTLTFFCAPYKRKTKAGAEYTRLEAYENTQKLGNYLLQQYAAGKTVTQVLARNIKVNGVDKIAVEVDCFKGRDKVETPATVADAPKAPDNQPKQ